MASDVKRIVVVAVEDNIILLTDGYYDRAASGRVNGFRFIEPVARPRETSVSEQGQEFVSGDLSRLADIICEFVNVRQQADPISIDAIGFSVFGNVDTYAEEIYHIPNRQNQLVEETWFNIRAEFERRMPESGRRKIYALNHATASALGEYKYGTEQIRRGSFAHISLGRGINGGLIVDGKPLVGLINPEMAHFLPRRHPSDHHYCNYLERETVRECHAHVDCMLTLASARAVIDRFKMGLTEEEISDIYAFYVAQLCLSITLIAMPEQIAIGGAIFEAIPKLNYERTMDNIREHFMRLKGVYPYHDKLENKKSLETFIIKSKRGNRAALLGMAEFVKQQIMT